LLFSATLPADLKALARAHVKDPVQIMVAKPATPVEGVSQALHHTSHDNKTSLLMSLLQQDRETVLVFTRTKHRADRLGRALTSAGHTVAVIHGNRSLPQRRAALEGFKRGRHRILVATDIAARGIDVANIGHVVNYDMPNCPEDYVHRIGRTARMKAAGRATSFVTAEEHGQLRAIEKLLGQSVPVAAGSQPAPKSSAPGATRNFRHTQGRPERPSGFRPGRSTHARPSHSE
jgi:ATP-dependent RNA helicase RhlE